MMTYSFAAGLWDSVGRLYQQDAVYRGMIARLNLKDEELLTWFRDETGIGKVHLRPSGRYWLASRTSDVAVLARRLWRSISPVRRDEFTTLLPDFRVKPPALDLFAMPADDPWAAALLALAKVVGNRRRIRLRVPGRGTLPTLLLSRFSQYTGGGSVIAAEMGSGSENTDQGYWTTENFDVIHALAWRLRPHLPQSSLRQFGTAMLRNKPQAPVDFAASTCPRCGQRIDPVSPPFAFLGRDNTGHCSCGYRLVDRDTLSVIRSWEVPTEAVAQEVAATRTPRSVRTTPSRTEWWYKPGNFARR